ncbi:MAG: MBOAT family protein [Bacteroidaceae bacterium]|nr:MBOAT family protein [Bacteroidaceae bacterium]
MRHYTTAKIALVVASLYFYAFFNWSYLPIIISSILVNYLVAWRMKVDDKPWLRKLWLVVGVAFNIGMIGYFKYFDFFIENVNALFKTDFTLRNILLPLGISFFTFQQVAFVVDSYRRKTELPGFLDYCNFVTFFPQLIAGPIVLPEEMLPQFEDRANRRVNYENMFNGLFIFALGLGKKVLIADSIAVFANTGFDLMTTYTMAEAWLTSLSYSFQLYFDFSGYCDMAIGIGLMFNIKLPLNFNAPYWACDFQDFWRRWHMTLNRFLTQYLYIPLGGSRRGEVRTLVNIFIVFLVSGIWHGAGWTFIVWGILHGIAMIVNRLWKKYGVTLPNWIAIPLTFFFVNIFWVFFRADSLSDAMQIVAAMFNNWDLTLTRSYTDNLSTIVPYSMNRVILFLSFVLGVFGKTAYQWMETKGHYRWKSAATIVTFVIGCLFISRVVTFLYFNF